MTVSGAGERALIERIRTRVSSLPSHIPIGIGDDAAVLQTVRGRHTVVTTDTLIEGVHFRLEWSSARSIGRKAVLVNLSDLAAMGAAPQAILLSLCLPPQMSLADFDALIDGVLDEARACSAPLIGGNITSSPGPLMVAITAIGAVHPRRALRRAGGRAGHELYVTGRLGEAAAGLDALQSKAPLTPGVASCVERYDRPPNLLLCSRAVAGHRAASACMDLSDGLADAIRQLAAASETGADVNPSALPIPDEVRAWWESRGQDPVSRVLSGGEDYELLFAVPPRRRRAFLSAARKTGTPVTRIGILTAGGELALASDNGRTALPEGFEHFKA